MRLNFNSLDIDGFLSMGNAHIELDDLGMTLVEGVNNAPGSPSSNGSGKSTIFEAIYYVFTGNTLRGTTDVINKFYGKSCSVSLNFDVDKDNYVVMRTRGHAKYGNNLKIYKNGEDISGDKLKKSEAILDAELPDITGNLISSVIILSQGMRNKFTSLKPTARKERLEELAKSSYFINLLKTRISNKSKESAKALSELNCNKASLDTKISMTYDNIDEKSKEKSKAESNDIPKDIDDNIAELESSLEQSKQKLSETNDLLSALSQKQTSLVAKVSSCNSRKDSLAFQKSKLQSQANNLATEICPTCGQMIKSPEKIAELRKDCYEQINQCDIEIQNLDTEISSYQGVLEMLNDKIKNLSSSQFALNSVVSETMSNLSKLNFQKSSSQLRVEEIEAKISELKKTVENLNIESAELVANIEEAQKKSDMLVYLNRIANKEFRTYLLSGVIDYLNKRVQYYSTKLFGTQSLVISGDDTKINITYEDKPYENLSGGEAQRADLAVQFAIRDMLATSIGFTTNILAIDEGFDNLDASGVQALIDVISSFSDISSVFIVSHHADLPIPYETKIRVTKSLDGVSSVGVINN